MDLSWQILSLNRSPTFSTVRESFDTRYFLPSSCIKSTILPSGEFRYQADTALAEMHLSIASSFGRVSLALIGDTVAEINNRQYCDIPSSLSANTHK